MSKTKKCLLCDTVLLKKKQDFCKDCRDKIENFEKFQKDVEKEITKRAKKIAKECQKGLKAVTDLADAFLKGRNKD